jgi:glutathione S-transferase
LRLFFGPSGSRLRGSDWESTPGSRRAEITKKFGKAQVPLLIDPNTDTEMFESSKTVRYLEETQAAQAVPSARVRGGHNQR